MELTEKQQKAVSGLRELADHLEANPELIDIIGLQKLYSFYHGKDKAEFARRALLLGNAEKSSDGAYFNVERTFGDFITIQVTSSHENVCERVVIDSQEVEVEERDEELVAAALAAIPVTKTTKVVERVEWKCPESLMQLAKEQ